MGETIRFYKNLLRFFSAVTPKAGTEGMKVENDREASLPRYQLNRTKGGGSSQMRSENEAFVIPVAVLSITLLNCEVKKTGTCR